MVAQLIGEKRITHRNEFYNIQYIQNTEQERNTKLIFLGICISIPIFLLLDNL